jgi:hypothetical protein
VAHQRFTQLLSVLLNQGEGTSVYFRVEHIYRSLGTFFQNPVLGKSYEVGFSFAKEAVFVGQHNEWFDIFARYGLLGGLPLILFIGYSLKDLYIDSHDKNTIFIIAIFIFLGFFNPIINTSILMFIFVVFPLLYKNKRSD